MSIEVKQFDGSSVTPKDDALLYDLIFNSYGVFNGCGISFLGVNQLRVASGRMIVKGRQVVITEETVAAQLSASGAKKGRLYIHIDLSNQTTPAQFMTQVEDVLPNLVQEDDVNYNDGIFEIELCTYDVSETAISNIVETCPIITGGVDLLKSMEEVLANTKPGKAVDALVVKELTDSLGGFSFQTVDGKKQVSIDGGETWSNFSGGLDLLWTNPNPTSAFPAQTLSIDLSGYESVVIQAKAVSSATKWTPLKTLIPKDGEIHVMLGNQVNYEELGDIKEGFGWYSRMIKVTDGGIEFKVAHISISQTSDTACIPLEIYGCGISLE